MKLQEQFWWSCTLAWPCDTLTSWCNLHTFIELRAGAWDDWRRHISAPLWPLSSCWKAQDPMKLTRRTAATWNHCLVCYPWWRHRLCRNWSGLYPWSARSSRPLARYFEFVCPQSPVAEDRTWGNHWTSQGSPNLRKWCLCLSCWRACTLGRAWSWQR